MKIVMKLTQLEWLICTCIVLKYFYKYKILMERQALTVVSANVDLASVC
jgi:hypothetical protein